MSDLIANPFVILILFTLLGITAIILSVLILLLISKIEKKEAEDSSISESFQKKLEELTEVEIGKGIKSWQESLKENGRETENKISEALNQLIGDFKNELEGLGEEIRKEVSGFGQINARSQDLLLEEMKEAVNGFEKKLKTEIEEYKKKRIDDMDQDIYRILGEVAKKTIGKTVNFSTHEELVMDALEQAKKENFFE